MALPSQTEVDDEMLAPTMGVDDQDELEVRRLRKGSILGGVYRVQRRLGQGGMGTVYVVEHTELGRRFAAKVVSKKLHEKAIARLLNEARVTSAIDHENIVDVVNLGREDDGSVFVIMELLRGEDLGNRLARRIDSHAAEPWLPPEELESYVPQILDGLAAAHEAGIIHRDLKPENVFLARRDDDKIVVKLLDFGIAKNIEPENDHRLTRTGQIIGTPLYMAPEQARNMSDADHRADIYSVGVILYEMVTGAPPFESDTLFDLILQHATEAPVSPTSRRPDLPEAVESVILRCLEKDRNDRFESVGALRAAWDDAWNGIAPEALVRAADVETAPRETGPPLPPTREAAATPAPVVVEAPAEEPVEAPSPSRLALAAGGGFLLVALLVGGGVAWLSVDSAPDPDPVAVDEPPAEPPAPVEVDDPATGAEAQDPEPAEEPGPPMHTRVLQTDPPGATVMLGDRVLGRTPVDVPFPEGETVEVTVVLADHVTRAVEVGDGDGPLLEVELERANARRGRRSRRVRTTQSSREEPSSEAPAEPPPEPERPRSSGGMLLGMDQFDSEQGR